MTHYGGFAALVHKLYTERNYWSASFHPRNRREKCMKLAKCDAVIGLLELWNWKNQQCYLCFDALDQSCTDWWSCTPWLHVTRLAIIIPGEQKKCLFTSEAFAYSTVATLTQVTLYIHLSSSNNPFSISLCSLALPVEGDCDFSPRSHINTQRDEPTCVRHNTPCVSWGTLTTEESN